MEQLHSTPCEMLHCYTQQEKSREAEGMQRSGDERRALPQLFLTSPFVTSSWVVIVFDLLFDSLHRPCKLTEQRNECAWPPLCLHLPLCNRFDSPLAPCPVKKRKDREAERNRAPTKEENGPGCLSLSLLLSCFS